jgi:oligopeptide transport system substrate-binding protein
LRFDEKLIPQPAAAESYDLSPDGTVYTFHLRQDARWSDGQPVTAQQFEYSWKRLMDPALKSDYASLFVGAGIAGADDYNAGRTPSQDNVGVRALDDTTLEIRLNQPNGAFPDVAALWVGVPLRQDLVEADPDGWASDPSTYVGNGPFMVAEWLHSDHLTLVQNPRYTSHMSWPKPILTRVTIAMATNPEQDFAAFQTSRRDWVIVPEPDISQVLNDPLLAPQSHEYNELTTFWVQLNTSRAPLSNVLLRRALAKGIDRTALVRDLAAGIGVPTTSIIPPGIPGAQEGLGHDLAFDAAGGRALLAQAGFGSPASNPRLTFSLAASPENLRRAQWLQAQWNDNLGLTVQLSPIDPPAFQQAISDKNYDMALGGWTSDYPDPRDWLGPVFSCSGAYNKSGYCSSGFDQIVASADIATSLDDRLGLYAQAQTLLVQDAPVLPLFVRGRLALVKPWVESVDGGPLQLTPLDDYPGSFFLDKVQILPH